MHNHYVDPTHPHRPYTHSLAATPGTMPPASALRGEKPAKVPGFWPCKRPEAMEYAMSQGWDTESAVTGYGPRDLNWPGRRKAEARKAGLASLDAHLK